MKKKFPISYSDYLKEKPNIKPFNIENYLKFFWEKTSKNYHSDTINRFEN